MGLRRAEQRPGTQRIDAARRKLVQTTRGSLRKASQTEKGSAIMVRRDAIGLPYPVVREGWQLGQDGGGIGGWFADRAGRLPRHVKAGDMPGIPGAASVAGRDSAVRRDCRSR